MVRMPASNPAAVFLSASLMLVLPPSCGSAPAPAGGTAVSPGAALDSLLCARESVRSYADSSLSFEEVQKLLWAGGGLLPDGRRTIPSAGALYPLRFLLVSGEVDGLAPGVYRYETADSSLIPVREGDARRELATACLGQPWVLDAPASIVIAAEASITTDHYGERGVRYVFMEAGHASQNIYLECAAMGLGTVAVGAFLDSSVAVATGLRPGEMALYVMPVGRIE
jgi:SagB-type dehydrogenase family enzyme